MTVQLDVVPATINGVTEAGPYHASWTRVVVSDDIMYVFRNSMDPVAELIPLEPGTQVLTRAGQWDVGPFNITSCGCSKGSWTNFTPEQLLDIAAAQQAALAPGHSHSHPDA